MSRVLDRRMAPPGRSLPVAERRQAAAEPRAAVDCSASMRIRWGFPLTAAVRDDYFTFLGTCCPDTRRSSRKNALNSRTRFSLMATSDKKDSMKPIKATCRSDARVWQSHTIRALHPIASSNRITSASRSTLRRSFGCQYSVFDFGSLESAQPLC